MLENENNAECKADVVDMTAVEPCSIEGTELDQDVVVKISELRTRVHETFGRVLLSMMGLPRYRHLSMDDLDRVILDPLICDRIAIATAKARDVDLSDGLSGIVIWASVSRKIDTEIRDQIKAGIFPLDLKGEDWTSGSINWLLDVIAPAPQVAASVVSGLRQSVPEGEMHIHPVVSDLVGAEMLTEMGTTPFWTETSFGQAHERSIPPQAV